MVRMNLDSTGIDPNQSNGFEPYEGPIPRPGIYAAVIKSCKVRISQNGNPYFNILFEFADQQTPEKQAFAGYPLWEKLTPGDSDIQKERVGKFMHAVCGKVKAVVDHDEVTDGGKVNKVGGKDPVGTKCKVITRRANFGGEPTAELADLFAWPKDVDWPEGAAEEDVEDEDVEDEEEEADDSEEEEEDSEEEEEEEDDGEFEARQEELSSVERAELKSILKDLDSNFKILKRHTDDDLREAILDLEYPPVEGDEEPPF